jgi:tRNA 2-thiouridine synthesizing protein A
MKTIDCTHMLCPLPVLKARKALAGMAEGQLLAVIATDAMAAVDLPHFCAQAGHSYLGAEPAGDATRHMIRRGPLAAKTDD